MIIDIHTHFAQWDTDIAPQLRKDMENCGIPADRWNYTEEDYIKSTQAADRAVVFGIKAKKTGWDTDNARTAAFAARDVRKHVFFASVDPSEPDFMEQLRQCHIGLSCKGVKLGPVYQGLHPYDKKYHEIYAYCQNNNLPIMTHMAATFTKGVPLEYARPILMDSVACEYPDLKITLAHMGHPWEGEAIVCIRRQPNLYADISALYYRPMQFYHTMRLLEEYKAGEKVFFGSDYPACTTNESIDGVKNVNAVTDGTGMPRVGHGLIDEILHRDSLALLGIE